MTILRNVYYVIFFTAFLIPFTLFAQTDDLATSTATSTDETIEEEPWYKLERLFGSVDSGDFVVGPGRSEIALMPGQSTVITVSVANRISDNRAFELSAADISGSSDGSSALTLIEGERGPYSITDYIDLPEKPLVLDLGDRARIPITISVPPDAEPGGYYGSILVSTVQLGSGPNDPAPRNPIIARVGSHVFLTVGGEQSYEGKTVAIDTIPTSGLYAESPIVLALTYENSGSVHVNPYGELSIRNLFGEEIGYVELEPWFVLPKSLRSREIQWNRDFLFGRYTAVAKVNRGYDDIIDEVAVAFWVLPYKVVATIFGVLFLIVFLIRLFFRTFEFKKK